MDNVKSVVRMENADGLGPYTAQVIDKLPRRYWQDLMQKPSPEEDGFPLEKSVGSYGGFCGFQDLAQLAKWVDGKLVLLRELGLHGIKIVEYQVPESKYFLCRSQVVFIKSAATKLSTMDIDNAFIHAVHGAYRKLYER